MRKWAALRVLFRILCTHLAFEVSAIELSQLHVHNGETPTLIYASRLDLNLLTAQHQQLLL